MAKTFPKTVGELIIDNDATPTIKRVVLALVDSGEVQESFPLNNEILKKIRNCLQAGADLNTDSENAELYQYCEEIEHDLNRQKIDNLESVLQNESDPMEKMHLCQSAIRLIYMRHDYYKYMSFSSTNYKNNKAEVDKQKIEADLQQVKAVIEKASLNFKEIEESVRKTLGRNQSSRPIMRKRDSNTSEYYMKP